MKIVLAIVSPFIVFSTVAADITQPAKTTKMITLQQLEEMFAGMRVKTNWHVDGDMLWGYFFTDSDAKKLEPVARELASEGYHVVGTHQTKDGDHYILHIERVETHTPESLDTRNQEFYRLAARLGIRSYEGMDIGPVPATK